MTSPTPLARLQARLLSLREPSQNLVDYWQAEIDRPSGYARVFHQETIDRHQRICDEIDAELAALAQVIDDAWLVTR